MASGSNSLIKGVFVLAFIAAVFVGLSFLLDPATDQPPVSASNQVNAASFEEAEAREFGAEIGARVGQEVGQRVGAMLVASLEGMPDETDESSQVATAEAVSDEGLNDQPAEAGSDSEQADLVTAQVIDELTDNSSDEANDESTVAETEPAESESTASDMEQEEAEPAPSHTIAVEPAIPAPTATQAVAESEPDPSKNFVFASEGWWSNPGKGLSISHVGQATSASGFKHSIIVILSAPYQGAHTLESLLRVSNASGDPVAGTWRRSANARNLLFHVGQPGNYKLHISGKLSSQDGGSLGTDLSGSLSIQ